MKAVVLTISDRCYRGESPDETGPRLREMLLKADIGVAEILVVPDEVEKIKTEIVRLTDQVGVDVVITNGGTGFGPRDVTPEATDAVLHRRAPGLAEAMRLGSLAHTPYAMLSRGTAGVRDKTLIVNLPGSPRGATECLEIILPVLDHAVKMIAGGQHRGEDDGDGGSNSKAV